MKPLHKHILVGFIIGILGTPLWILISSVGLQGMGMSASELAEYPMAFTFDYLLLKMLIGGAIGALVALLVLDIPKWIKQMRAKKHGLTSE